MRDITALQFRFRFIDTTGRTDVLPTTGSINDIQLKLGKGCIFVDDIYKVNRYQNKLIITLYPFATVSGNIAKRYIGEHHAIIIQTSSFAKELEANIDRKIGKVKILHKRQIKDNTAKLLSTQCPSCHSPIDLENRPATYYSYCDHCGAIFNKYGYSISEGEHYGICPETGYFDRIKNYREYKMFISPQEVSFSAKKYYCSDMLEIIFLKEYFYKNITLLIGVFLMGVQHIFSKTSRQPDFEELGEANYYAYTGEMSKAWDIYHQMISRLPHHPGFYHNLGLAYLKLKRYKRAVKYFEKALDGCSNYTPTLKVLEKYKRRAFDYSEEE
ncbi:tetratricopeptide repeat protein [Algivirga pacifica]|uniref:Tetratricopeptide repeat protein n=1 Tax=Algivirga pacifica TaxID=1162670 RepID=A0ABP9DDZ7_9BACT